MQKAQKLLLFSLSETDGDAEVAAAVAMMHRGRRRAGTRCRNYTMRSMQPRRANLVMMMRFRTRCRLSVVTRRSGMFTLRGMVRGGLRYGRKDCQHGDDDELFHNSVSICLKF